MGPTGGRTEQHAGAKPSAAGAWNALAIAIGQPILIRRAGGLDVWGVLRRGDRGGGLQVFESCIGMLHWGFDAPVPLSWEGKRHYDAGTGPGATH